MSKFLFATSLAAVSALNLKQTPMGGAAPPVAGTPPAAGTPPPAGGAPPVAAAGAPAPAGGAPAPAAGGAPAAGARTWTICEGPQFHPPTEAQIEASMKAANAMQCTKPLVFEELCCLDYQNLEGQLTEPADVMLDLAQQADGDPADGGLMFMQDDAAQDPNAKQVTICTRDSIPVEDPAAPGGAAPSATIAPVNCFAHEFNVADIKSSGQSGNGNLVLNARMQYLAMNGLTPESIPTCPQKVPQCPNGKPPAAGNMDAALAPPALLQGKKVQGKKDTRPRGRRGAFLMTSGSFTLSSGGGSSAGNS